jgi:polyferredoxin
MLGVLAWRSDTGVSVLHDRDSLFVTLSDGGIRNGYTLKLLNKAREPRLYRRALAGDLPATYRVLGQEGRGGPGPSS